MNLKYFSDPRDAEKFEPFPIVFSRGSVAYEGNGAPLASNQPSFIEGSKGVYGLGVYEQYTNLLISKISLGQSGYTSWSAETGLRQVANETVFTQIGTHGTRLTSTFNGSQNMNLLNSNSPVSVTAGQQITISVLVYIPSNGKNVNIPIYWRGDITVNSLGDSLSYVPGRLQWLHRTATVPAGATTMHSGFYQTGASNNDFFVIDAMQIINKPYPLPWIIGGTTRQPDNCYILVEELKKFLNLDNACIEGLIYSNPAYKLRTDDHRRIIYMHDAWNKNRLDIFKHTNGAIQSTLVNNDNVFTNLVINNPDDIIGQNLPFSLSLTKKNSNLVIKNQIISIADPTVPSKLNHFMIASEGYGDPPFTGRGKFANTHLPFISFSKSRTMDDITRRQKFAIANGYYQIDDKVTAFLDLESGLRGYRRVR